MPEVLVRKAAPSDLEQLAQLRTLLWPASPIEEHAEELHGILAGNAPGILPLIEFVAEAPDGTLVGFAEVGLRSCVDGCDLKQPVGYLEGWYVVEDYRRRGIGGQLLATAEEWARTQGCIEMASDSEIENITSQRVHEALGFEVTGRSVNYRKKI